MAECEDELNQVYLFLKANLKIKKSIPFFVLIFFIHNNHFAVIYF